MKTKIVLFLSVFLIGCTPPANMPLAKNSNTGRVTVTQTGVFEDVLAYNNRRGIYIIKDNDTGKEYIGISGIGISEVASHSAGKSRISDER